MKMNDEIKKQINKIAERFGGVVVEWKRRQLELVVLATIEHMENMEREAVLLNNAAEAQEEEEIHYEGR